MSERRAALVVLTALLVVLAGCGGFYDEREPPGKRTGVTAAPGGGGTGGGGGGHGGGDGEGDVVRPSTPVTLSPEDRLAPGVSTERLVNPGALLAAHGRELAASGFAMTYDHESWRTAEGVDSTWWERDAAGTVRATADLERYLVRTEERTARPPTTRFRYGDGDGPAVVKAETPDGGWYDEADGNASPDLARYFAMGNFFEWGNWTVESVRDGGDVVVLTATGLEPYARPVDDRTTNYTAFFTGRAVVTDEGVVRSMNVSYRVREEPVGREYEDRRVRLAYHEFTYAVTKRGDVTVERPSWVATARNRTRVVA